MRRSLSTSLLFKSLSRKPRCDPQRGFSLARAICHSEQVSHTGVGIYGNNNGLWSCLIFVRRGGAVPRPSKKADLDGQLFSHRYNHIALRQCDFVTRNHREGHCPSPTMGSTLNDHLSYNFPKILLGILKQMCYDKR